VDRKTTSYKRIKCSTNPSLSFQAIGLPFAVVPAFATFLAGLLLATGCTNNLSSLGKGSSSGATHTVITSDGDSGSGLVTLERVIEDPSMTGTFDLIGDGTNAIGQVCAPDSTDTSSSDLNGAGPSTCQCAYSYTRSNGNTEQLLVDTTYHEANLLRCPYDTLPTDISSVSVAITQTTSGASSNSISFSLNGYTSATNLSDANSFVQVTRYQCRDIVTIPYMLGPGLTSSNSVYDPIQSEDPTISYPLNFYTTNFGGTFSLYVSRDVRNWDCPSIPNDPNVPGLDLRVFSVGSDSAGSKQIYPPAGSAFDRSTFYVSKVKAGVFNIPLNTYVAPQTFGNGGGANPVGYAASPIATSSTTETCPDASVTIPAGYQWAKLWLFRADLAPRYYRKSTAISSLSIGCNPGKDSLGNVAFGDCDATGFTADTTQSPPQLADRIIGGAGNATASMCVNINGPFGTCTDTTSSRSYFQGPGCTTDGDGTEQGGYPYSLYGLGTDIWQPRSVLVKSTDTTLTDPLDLFGKKGTTQNIPKDANPGSANLDVGNPRYDFLFVTTPVSVMAADMENTSSSVNYPYTPYRFPSKTDCLSSDPDNPSTSGDCNPSKIIHYGLKLHDISSNGDPSGSDPNRNGTFPMCVLQPI
jgi:hypothetical protein